MKKLKQRRTQLRRKWEGVKDTIKLVRRARSHGAKRAYLIHREARRADVPYSLALTLVEQESGFKNIHGCDQGSILCHEKVTRESVARLIRWIKNGGTSNGVGLTQLTYPPFIYEAERLGGAHRPRYQLRVGFRVLADNIQAHGYHAGIRLYNGSGPAAEAYAERVKARRAVWREWLHS